MLDTTAPLLVIVMLLYAVPAFIASLNVILITLLIATFVEPLVGSTLVILGAILSTGYLLLHVYHSLTVNVLTPVWEIYELNH